VRDARYFLVQQLLPVMLKPFLSKAEELLV
jgi:hypothetical protein